MPEFETEDQTRARLRASALQLERELVELMEDPDDPDPRNTRERLSDVQQTLAAIGRKAPYSEHVAIQQARPVR